jgi:molybdopterin converting factor subunit 1
MVKIENNEESNQITVRVLFFGAARDAVGQGEVTFAVNNHSRAATTFAQLLTAFPELRRFGRSLLFAINEEYAPADREVHEGDELAVFPPVSGGSGGDGETRREGEMETAIDGDTGRQADAGTGEVRQAAGCESNTSSHDFFELTTEPIDVGAVARRIVLPECGATLTLDGYAREWTKGRRTLFLIYEAYSSMALSEMRRLGREAHQRFEIAHIGIVHRTGRLDIGETSVVIAISAPHRRAAFEACEWAIRELKRTVPIWKKETFEDGEVWVEGEEALK